MSVLLVASVGLNLYLFHQGVEYFRQLNDVRLDPLGLGFYPTTSLPRHAGDKPVVVFFGDSRALAWPAPAEINGANFINRGIGNQTTTQVLGRFPFHVAPLKPKIVILQVGINDLKAIPLFPARKDAIVRDCKANIRRLVKQSQETGAKVVLTTIFPVGRVPLERRPFWSDDVAPAVKDVNAYIASLRSDQVTIFDATRVLANDQGTMNPAYSQDFLHLNAAGYTALNRELVGFLRPWLPATDSGTSPSSMR